MAHDHLGAQLALANERTFLSWIRTSLALVVTGAALVAFTLPIAAPWRTAAATLFILLGIGAAVQGWWGWRATDAALKRGEDLPAPPVRVYLAVGVVAATAVLGVGLLAS